MSTSSFARILMILDVFSVQRPVIDVDDICTELDVSKPMAYRYLKELVESGLLKKAHHSVGSYVLGSKVAVLDYIARESDPWVQLCIPQMREVVNRTEMLCLITALEGRSCIDIHHESFRNEELVYGRGCPRALSAGSSAKIILANLAKKQQIEYYQYLAEDLANNGFAENEAEFISKLRQIKKQGYYVSQGELHPDFSSISVPVRYSSKEAPWAMTVLASTNRFEFIDTQKIVEMLKRSTDLIEQQALQIENEIVQSPETDK